MGTWRVANSLLSSTIVITPSFLLHENTAVDTCMYCHLSERVQVDLRQWCGIVPKWTLCGPALLAPAAVYPQALGTLLMSYQAVAKSRDTCQQQMFMACDQCAGQSCTLIKAHSFHQLSCVQWSPATVFMLEFIAAGGGSARGQPQPRCPSLNDVPCAVRAASSRWSALQTPSRTVPSS